MDHHHCTVFEKKHKETRAQEHTIRIQTQTHINVSENYWCMLIFGCYQNIVRRRTSKYHRIVVVVVSVVHTVRVVTVVVHKKKIHGLIDGRSRISFKGTPRRRAWADMYRRQWIP